MKIEAKIKIIGEEFSGTSQETGEKWRCRMLLLEWEDMEGIERVWAPVFNERMDDFNEQGFAQGDLCQVDIVFTPKTYPSLFNKTNLTIKNIRKISGKEAAL